MGKLTLGVTRFLPLCTVLLAFPAVVAVSPFYKYKLKIIVA